MTTTRYPGNPDWHEVPPRCFDCGRFCGGPESETYAVWKLVNPFDDLPELHRCRCPDCAEDEVVT